MIFFFSFLFLWSTTCLMLCGWNGNTCMQVLWNSSCLDSLLFSVHNDSPSTVINDPALIASIRSLYQRIVREWISISLSYAPCTSQGLLQVGFTIFPQSDEVDFDFFIAMWMSVTKLLCSSFFWYFLQFSQNHACSLVCLCHASFKQGLILVKWLCGYAKQKFPFYSIDSWQW